MELTITGTGGTRGWPEPGCPCASCARAAAAPRRPYEVTLDGRPLAGSIPGRLGVRPEPGDGPYDVVLLDLAADPYRLGALRHTGVIGATTRVIPLWLDHRWRSPAELTRRLAQWGVPELPDGTRVPVTPYDEPSAPPAGGNAPHRPHAPSAPSAPSAGRNSPHAPSGLHEPHALHTPGAPPAGRNAPRLEPGGAGRTIVIGGARSGKSEEAELRLAGAPDVTYVATGPRGDGDPAWRARVAAHRERRPAHWRTAETTDLAPLLARPRAGALLVDGLGTWLAAVMDDAGVWDAPGVGDGPEHTRVRNRMDALVTAWRATRSPLVAVTDDVGGGLIPDSPGGRYFRDLLGTLNRRLAGESERVVQVVAGRAVELPE